MNVANLGSFTLADWLQQWLDVGVGEPAYRQLYRLIRRAILDGHLARGTRLPSSRSLAAELSIARNTVLQVYEQLELEGYVDATIGRGTFVADISQDLFDEPIGAPDSAPEKPCEKPRHDLSPRGRAPIGSMGSSRRPDRKRAVE